MIQRFIHHARVERAPLAETATEARERLGGKFPRGAARRMTHLGMLLGAAAEEVVLTSSDAVVYASTFAETRALEDFLGSFPTPSPLLFQTSIHPGGVQQVLIGRQQPVGRLWPLAGSERIVEQALLAALLEPATRVLLLGGEEKGTWLLEHGMASDCAFALALALTTTETGAAARLALMPESAGAAAPDAGPTLGALTDAVAGRKNLAWRGADGRWTLEWQ